jgi:hypothetical protein
LFKFTDDFDGTKKNGSCHSAGSFRKRAGKLQPGRRSFKIARFDIRK